MTDENPNPFLQNNFEHFERPAAPRRARQPRAPSRASRDRLLGAVSAKLKSPLVASIGLLATGAAFGAIIAASYPHSQGPETVAPLIQAQTEPYRQAPDNPGGQDIANQDSTVYSSLDAKGLEEKPPIENLLADEKPADAADENAAQSSSSSAPSHEDLAKTDPAPSDNETYSASGLPPGATKGEPDLAPPATASRDAGHDMPPQPGPNAKRAAADSAPETVAYLKSVLDKKDAGDKITTASAASVSGAAIPPVKASSAPSAPRNAPSAIEPAAGAASPGAGSTYIQLGSVPTRAGVDTEWSKLKKTYPQLGTASYRVTETNVEGRGTFYRIQAGPMTKDSANSVCASIKAQKPGGCIIVK